MASWRCVIGVVPAWFVTPSTVTFQRMIPTMPWTTPISTSRRSSSAPCSTCSSRKPPMVSGPRAASASRSGLPPMRARPSPIVKPEAVTMSSSSGSTFPASARLPVFPPSSLGKITKWIGCLVARPTSASVQATSTAAIEPTWPSKFPPFGTESMCEPSTSGFSSGSVPARRPHRLPATSTETSRPAPRISSAAHARASRSASENATRSMPPASFAPKRESSWRRPRRRAPSTRISWKPPGSAVVSLRRGRGTAAAARVVPARRLKSRRCMGMPRGSMQGRGSKVGDRRGSVQGWLGARAPG